MSYVIKQGDRIVGHPEPRVFSTKKKARAICDKLRHTTGGDFIVVPSDLQAKE